MRVQWDPERDLLINPLNYRAIQIGLSGEAVQQYTSQWIQNITDITEQVQEMKSHIDQKEYEKAKTLLPPEKVYPIEAELMEHLGMTPTE